MKTYLTALFLSFYFLILPIWPLIILTGCAIFLDTIVGIIKTLYLKRPFLSNKLGRLGIKIFLYTAIIIIVYFFDLHILSAIYDMNGMLVKIIAGALIFTEGLSLDEHVRELNNNKGVKYYFNKIVKTIKRVKQETNDIVKKPEE